MSGIHARIGKAGGDSHVHGMLDQKLFQFDKRFLDNAAEGSGFKAKFHFVGI